MAICLPVESSGARDGSSPTGLREAPHDPTETLSLARVSMASDRSGMDQAGAEGPANCQIVPSGLSVLFTQCRMTGNSAQGDKNYLNGEHNKAIGSFAPRGANLFEEANDRRAV